MDIVRKYLIKFLNLIHRNFFRDNTGEEADEERAQQIFEKCNKIEQQFGHLFTSKKKENFD